MIKILVIGPSWVGDMVMAQSLLKTLKQKHANEALQIDVLAPAWTHALLSCMPEVDNALPMPLGHGTLGLRARYQLGQSLRHQGYTHAYVLPNSWKSALIPWFAKIPKRIGWRGEWRYGLLNDCRPLDKKAFPYMVQRFAALAEDKPPLAGKSLDGIPLPEMAVSPPFADQVADKFVPNHAKYRGRILALCPGAEFGPSKQWPARHYAAVAQHFHQLGWQIWILGSAKDAVVAEEIGAPCILLAGKTQLPEAIALMSQATAVVSNDSGLMHIAAALGKPLVAIYGSTDPSFTPPLSREKQANTQIIETSLSCRPCFKRICPLTHHACMQSIAPSQVIEAIEKLQTCMSASSMSIAPAKSTESVV